MFAEVPMDREGPVLEIPALCIEVLSKSRSYDRMTKRLVYAEAGVRELWTVSSDGTLERWSGEHLSERQVCRGELRSPLLPGFVFDLAQLHDAQ